MDNGESVIRYWSANHETPQVAVVNGRQQTVKTRARGYFILTTHRLVFVKERGVFGKSYHIDLSFSLEDLRGLSMGGLVMKYVSMSDSNRESVFHISGVGNETEFGSFKQSIRSQQAARRQAIEAEKRKDRIQIIMDFSFLRDYMNKGGLSLQVVKCPQCGASISLPTQGDEVKCEHCGSTIFAQDVMEKIKQLIG